jgi:hypothetical protein
MLRHVSQVLHRTWSTGAPEVRSCNPVKCRQIQHPIVHAKQDSRVYPCLESHVCPTSSAAYVKPCQPMHASANMHSTARDLKFIGMRYIADLYTPKPHVQPSPVRRSTHPVRSTPSIAGKRSSCVWPPNKVRLCPNQFAMQCASACGRIAHQSRPWSMRLTQAANLWRGRGLWRALADQEVEPVHNFPAILKGEAAHGLVRLVRVPAAFTCNDAEPTHLATGHSPLHQDLGPRHQGSAARRKCSPQESTSRETGQPFEHPW